MRHVKTVLSVVLAVFWIAVTGHCQLENVPGLELLACESAPASTSHCGDDFCKVLESGLYKISNHAPVITPDCFLSESIAVLMEDSPPNDADALIASGDPPGLPKTWQFVFRTALPVRAPSIAS